MASFRLLAPLLSSIRRGPVTLRRWWARAISSDRHWPSVAKGCSLRRRQRPRSRRGLCGSHSPPPHANAAERADRSARRSRTFRRRRSCDGRRLAAPAITSFNTMPRPPTRERREALAPLHCTVSLAARDDAAAVCHRRRRLQRSDVACASKRIGAAHPRRPPRRPLSTPMPSGATGTSGAVILRRASARAAGARRLQLVVSAILQVLLRDAAALSTRNALAFAHVELSPTVPPPHRRHGRLLPARKHRRSKQAVRHPRRWAAGFKPSPRASPSTRIHRRPTAASSAHIPALLHHPLAAADPSARSLCAAERGSSLDGHIWLAALRVQQRRLVHHRRAWQLSEQRAVYCHRERRPHPHGRGVHH